MRRVFLPPTRSNSLVALALCAAIGCTEEDPGGTPSERDANVSVSDAAVVDAPAPVDSGPARNDAGIIVLPAVASPAASDDQRLASFVVEGAGTSPNGWDTCRSAPFRRAPEDCSGCLPSPTGKDYLRYTTLPGQTGLIDPPGVPPTAQIFAYFTPALAAGQPQGLWFEVLHIEGDVADVTLTIDATNKQCEVQEPLGVWDLSALLSGPKAWRTSCVTLKPSASTVALGFSFTGGQVAFGFAAPRFGPACPLP